MSVEVGTGTKIALAAAVTAAAAVQPTGAASAVEGEYRPGLCESPHNPHTITSAYQWGEYSRIRGTSDWSPADYYSFRTCSWVGTDQIYDYDCTTEATNGWVLHIVENHHGSRVSKAVLCNDTQQSMTWTRPHNQARIHYHLWSPTYPGDSNPTQCADTCPRFIYGWDASVK